MSGRTNGIQDAAVTIATAAFDSYNPVGGEDAMSAITPTILDTPSDIARNRSWTGGLIKPDWLKGLPASEQKFSGTDDTLTGKIAVKTADTLASAGIQISPNDMLYAYNSYIGGVGKFASRVADTVSAIATGDPLVAKEVPFANRFFKTRSEEQVQKALVYKGQDELFTSLRKFKTGSEEQKTAIKNYLRGQASDSERQGTLFKLRDQGFDTKGISYSGKKLGVGNVPIKSEKVSFQNTKDQPQNILDKVSLAAQGMGKDPRNTINAIFTQEELRKIEGNAVILKRQQFLNKGDDPNLQRDHIIPLGLGGDNSEENLKYVSKDWHAAKTKNDNRLIGELQSGKITREEAQSQVKSWIEANPHETFVMESEPTQSTELETAYLSKSLSMPQSNRYEKSKRDRELYSSLSTIDSDEYLTEQQKTDLRGKVASELGKTPRDLQIYSVAKEDNDSKTLYAYDQIDKSTSFDDTMRYLVNGRKPVNGKILVSDGVINNLVADGFIPYALGKDIKEIDLNEDGTRRGTVKSRGGGRSGSKKSNAAQLKAVNDLGENLKKIKIGTSKIRTTQSQRITTKGLTFSGR